MAIVQKNSSANHHILKNDERILVVKRSHLFAQTTAWHGIKKVDHAHYLAIIQDHKEFLWRSDMEQDPTYKQIIPYLIFEFNNHYFLMQRRSNASAQALQNKYSLGIGGHIRQEDLTSGSIIDWARREFHEEVDYTGTFNVEPLGMINDDSNLIGQVHIGFALLIRGDSDNISVKSELKSGTLLSLEECATFYDRMETWSQMVFDLISNKPN